MTGADKLLDQFERREYYWCGDVSYRFWGGERLHTVIELDHRETQPTESQIGILAWLLRKRTNIRLYLQSALFQHYQDDVYGSVGFYSKEKGWYGEDEITPPLNDAEEIWSLLWAPSIVVPPIPSRAGDTTNRFKISFCCHWDEEHGLAAQFKDWKIIRIASAGGW